jgi:hypothetical protein
MQYQHENLTFELQVGSSLQGAVKGLFILPSLNQLVYGNVASMDVDISDSQQHFPHSPAELPKLHPPPNIAAPPKVPKSSAGLALPNVLKPPPANNILTDINIHDLQQYAMEDHLQLQAKKGSLPENMFDIPDDLTSIQMGMLGDAARIGNRHEKHVLHFVDNVENYFERTALHVMKDIESGKEELKVEEAIGKEAERLMEDLTSGSI